jgi:hypothetical protein
VCAPTLIIQEIVLLIQRSVTSHDDPKPSSSGPQPNDNFEAGNNEMKKMICQKMKILKIMTLIHHCLLREDHSEKERKPSQMIISLT